jgi:spore maturation protein SpmB
MYRSQFGAADPAVVWLPILLATSCSTLTGIGLVAWKQNIPCDRILLAWLGGWCATLVLLALLIYLSPASLRSHYAGLFGQIALVAVVVGTLFAGMRAKRDLYDDFIRGAKTGIRLFIKIIPHLVAMITAISMLRASGLLEGLLRALEKLCVLLSIDPDFLPALPTALMKPLSGSGARATMIDTIQTHGVDSFPALVATVMQGSTETTFYVLTLYFGAVGIRRIRYALGVSLLADAAGMVAAVVVSYLFFA